MLHTVGKVFTCLLATIIIRHHRMHSARPIATDDPVAWCINLSVMLQRCAKTAERIEVLYRNETPGEPRHIVLDSIPNPLYGERE